MFETNTNDFGTSCKRPLVDLFPKVATRLCEQALAMCFDRPTDSRCSPPGRRPDEEQGSCLAATPHQPLPHESPRLEVPHPDRVEMLNVLSVVLADVEYEGLAVPSQFMDFAIDGRLLRETLRVGTDLAAIEQETTLLRADFPHAAVEQIDRLTLASTGEFKDGRVALFLCPVCGDVACGTVSARISTEAHTVTWEDFGWQDGYTKEPPQPWLFERQRFTFDKTAYLTLMKQLSEQFTELLPPHQIEDEGNRRSVRAWLRRLRS
ncbi:MULTISPECIES: hypothetical protein [unclassified Arthrobacter]|uniref:hypothetical protein n=1 Tax=Arthrobacter sp. CAL618 TaxID=1055770 RepID=UPI0012ECAD1C